MTKREKAAFWAMTALIFPAFAPLDATGGMFVAIAGFVVCGTTAAVLWMTAE